MNYFEFVTSEYDGPASSANPFNQETKEKRNAYSMKTMLAQEQEEEKEYSKHMETKTRPKQHSRTTTCNLEVVPPRPRLSKNKETLGINHDFAAFWHSESTIATMQTSALSLDLEISIDDDDRSCSSLSSLSSYGSWSSFSVVGHEFNQEKVQRWGNNETIGNINCKTKNQLQEMVIGDQTNQLISFNKYLRKAKQIMQHLQ